MLRLGNARFDLDGFVLLFHADTPAIYYHLPSIVQDFG